MENSESETAFGYLPAPRFFASGLSTIFGTVIGIGTNIVACFAIHRILVHFHAIIVVDPYEGIYSHADRQIAAYWIVFALLTYCFYWIRRHNSDSILTGVVLATYIAAGIYCCSLMTFVVWAFG